jgi:DNA-binding PadR family transcriptional regulator
MLAWAGESQYYVEPKRLAKLGYLSTRKEPGKKRERTVYALTDKGLGALRKYAETPVTFTPLKSEPLLRLLIGAALYPHREKYLLLVIGFLRKLFELHLELVDEVERELA